MAGDKGKWPCVQVPRDEGAACADGAHVPWAWGWQAGPQRSGDLRSPLHPAKQELGPLWQHGQPSFSSAPAYQVSAPAFDDHSDQIAVSSGVLCLLNVSHLVLWPWFPLPWCIMGYMTPRPSSCDLNHWLCCRFSNHVFLFFAGHLY